jgi:hypothetical protein
MLVVLTVASYLAFWDYLRRWEARRVVMQQQHEVTRSILREAEVDLAVGPPASRVLRWGDTVTYTTHWTERIAVSEGRGESGDPLLRATVSGANGRFSLPPIRVEVQGPLGDGPWLDRLLRAYRERGWRYEVIRAAVPRVPGVGPAPPAGGGAGAGQIPTVR